MVTASYLSDYHVHKQKISDRNLSDFQIKLREFTDDITKLGTIRKLVHITNGLWVTPLECAQAAVNEAGSGFPFVVRYRELASAEDNDIELVTDQNLLPLQWQPGQPEGPGSIFLDRICTQVFDLVFFFFFFSESY